MNTEGNRDLYLYGHVCTIQQTKNEILTAFRSFVHSGLQIYVRIAIWKKDLLLIQLLFNHFLKQVFIQKVSVQFLPNKLSTNTHTNNNNEQTKMLKRRRRREEEKKKKKRKKKSDDDDDILINMLNI